MTHKTAERFAVERWIDETNVDLVAWIFSVVWASLSLPRFSLRDAEKADTF